MLSVYDGGTEKYNCKIPIMERNINIGAGDSSVIERLPFMLTIQDHQFPLGPKAKSRFTCHSPPQVLCPEWDATKPGLDGT